MLLYLCFKLSTLCRQLEAVCVARRFFLCYNTYYYVVNQKIYPSWEAAPCTFLTICTP